MLRLLASRLLKKRLLAAWKAARKGGRWEDEREWRAKYTPRSGHSSARPAWPKRAITSSRVPGVHGRGSAKVDTGIAPLLRELDRCGARQRCTTLDPAI